MRYLPSEISLAFPVVNAFFPCVLVVCASLDSLRSSKILLRDRVGEESVVQLCFEESTRRKINRTRSSDVKIGQAASQASTLAQPMTACW